MPGGAGSTARAWFSGKALRDEIFTLDVWFLFAKGCSRPG